MQFHYIKILSLGTGYIYPPRGCVTPDLADSGSIYIHKFIIRKKALRDTKKVTLLSKEKNKSNFGSPSTPGSIVACAGSNDSLISIIISSVSLLIIAGEFKQSIRISQKDFN